MARLQLRRGLKTNLPTTGMLAGEAHFTTDRGTLHVATDPTTKLPVVPAIDDLTTLASVDGAADLLIIHDASQATGQKEKKITFDAFKTALNIPPGSSDEKVSVVATANSLTLGQVKDVDISQAEVGDVLMFKGTKWEEESLDGGTFN